MSWLLRGFVTSSYFTIYFTIFTGLNKEVRYTEDFVMSRLVKSRFHCVCEGGGSGGGAEAEEQPFLHNSCCLRFPY